MAPSPPAPISLDALYKQAIALLDAGDIPRLRELVDAEPRLLRERTDWHDPPCDGYFRQPYLLWFVAENPIRNGKLPLNIAEVTRTLIDAARRHGVANLREQLDYTLCLVGSGMVPRQSGVQRDLIRVLTEAGADPTGALDAALGHRELDAVRALLEHGAQLTLPAAAALGKLDDVKALLASGTEKRQAALVCAAGNGHADVIHALIDAGADPSAYNPANYHQHCTPLHIAISENQSAALRALVERGGRLDLRDRIWNGTPLGWAEYFKRGDMAAYLREKGGVS